MVRVRTYESDSVAPASTTTARFRPADDGGLGFAIGQGAEQLGRALGNFAQVQDELNLRFDDTESRKAAQRYQTGAAKIVSDFGLQEGANAYSGRTATEEALTKLRDDTIGSMTNDRMRRMAEDRIAGLYAADTIKVGEHATGQLRVEQENTLRSQVILSGEDAAANWDRPELLRKHLDTMDAALDDLAQMKGWGEDQAKLEKANARSAVHKDVSNNFLARGDIDGALVYLDAHADEMNANDELSVRAALKDPMLTRMAEGDFERAIGSVPVPEGAASKDAAPAGTTLETMVAVTAQSESGNREYNADGSRVTSPKGARGRMQVMPATARKPGYGIKPSDGTPAEDERVGKQLLGKLLQRYSGDPAKAWAAYNWGAENVDKMVDRYGSDWLSHAPAETQGYVKKNVAAIGGGVQQGPRTWDKNAVYAQIDALAEKERWQPERRERAKEWADKQIQRDEQLLQRQERDADRDASEWVLSHPNFTDLSQMPASIRDRLSPDARLQYMGVAKQNAKPKEVPANGNAALGLTLMSINDPEQFKNLPLGQFSGSITRAELETFAKQQATMRANEGKWSPRTGIMSAIEWGKKVGQVKLDDREYAQVYSIMEAQVSALHAKKGDVTAKDYEDAFRNATRSVETRTTFIGLPTGSGEQPLYRVRPNATQRAAIVKALEAEGETDPSEDRINDLFRRTYGRK